MKADPMVPKTPAADAALSVATRFCSPALLNHSLRCYLWGAMYGALSVVVRQIVSAPLRRVQHRWGGHDALGDAGAAARAFGPLSRAWDRQPPRPTR